MFTPEFRNRLDAIDLVRGARRRRPSAGWSTSSSCSWRRSSPTATSPSSSTTARANGWPKKGYDKLFGARPLARVIQEHIKKPLAEELLFGKLVKGGVVKVSRDKEADKLAFAYEEAPPPPPAKAAPKEPEFVE